MVACQSTSDWVVKFIGVIHITAPRLPFRYVKDPDVPNAGLVLVVIRLDRVSPNRRYFHRKF